MRKIIDFLISEFHERPFPKVFPREQVLNKAPGMASIIIGMRRSGKTWFCYQQMQQLQAQGISKEQILYINFEDDRLLPFSATDFDSILEMYFRKYPYLKKTRCYLFFDEIQRIPGWDSFIRRILDTENADVYVTGSSSKMLSTEIATSLRGRAMSTEIFPFNFREYLGFHQIEINSNTALGSHTKAQIQHAMGDYFKVGGFPNVQHLDDTTRRQVLGTYVDVVILRDLIERYRIKNTQALRLLIQWMTQNPSKKLSINNFFNGLKGQGIPVTKGDLYTFLDQCNDVYLAFECAIHSRSTHVRRMNPSKRYIIDNGICEANRLPPVEDRGAWLENLVFMHLRAKGMRPDYYVGPNGTEVDFIIQENKGEPPKLIQVCWNLQDPKTRQREVHGLQTAMKELNTNAGTIVTWLDDRQVDSHIEVIPVWRWMIR